MIQMKKTKLLLLCAALMILTSCTGKTEENPEKVLHEQLCIKMYETIEQCIEKADYIVTCTVSEIGETYIFGDKEISENSTPEEINSYIRSICTPVTLDIDDVLYSNRDIADDTMTVTLWEGKYNGYELKKDFPEYEKNHTYLLFVKTAPDGETNIIMHQGSVEISDSGFVPLFNQWIYEGITSVGQVEERISAGLAG